MLRRRGFLGALLAAPAVITRPGLLMPVRKPLFQPRTFYSIDPAYGIDQGMITAFTITAGGSGYSMQPVITITSTAPLEFR